MLLSKEREDKMMKKTYCKPVTENFSVELKSMVAASVVVEKTTRWDTGVPTEVGGDNYGTVKPQIYNGSDFDHFNGRGGGENGSGNRSKGGLWYDDEEDW